jgi:translocation and assembly module TamA
MLVDLASHSARIRLALETGPRYSFGATGITQESLDEDFLRRYLRYSESDPYDASQLLRTQFALDDSQYFSTVEVVAGEPDRERLVIPVEIRAEPNRRNRYSVGVGYATDSKARGTLTWDNRRLNDRGHRLRAEIKAAQVEQSVEGRYVIPIGDPALEKFSMEARYGREDRGDLETSTLRFQPSVTHVLGDWQRVGFVSFSQVRTVTAATATQPESSESNRLIIPGLSYASVPRGYLGEALFSRGFFAEVRGSTTCSSSRPSGTPSCAASSARPGCRRRRSCPAPNASSPAATAACAASASTTCRRSTRAARRSADGISSPVRRR